MIYVVYALIFFSAFFALAGVIGILRMPDTFCRMQSSTNITSFGMIGVIAGGALYAGFILRNDEMLIKLLVMGLFYILTTPISAHAIAKGAYHHGVKMVDEAACDQYKEDMENE
ncbi:MAG: monovalent cation/H(+) antiporter subunit G [Firmicutes bacterium]|nr:monovalent cation/H(+) antiporter subunit G [Bacillota bacterium]